MNEQKTEEFIRLVDKLREYFKDRLEVPDSNIGHLAIIIQDELKAQREEIIKKINKFKISDDTISRLEMLDGARETFGGFNDGLGKAISLIKEGD